MNPAAEFKTDWEEQARPLETSIKFVAIVKVTANKCNR